MLRVGHQTVFGLCLALFVMVAVSFVCVTLLLVERKDTGLLVRHITSLQQENFRLRAQLNGSFEDRVRMPRSPSGSAR